MTNNEYMEFCLSLCTVADFEDMETMAALGIAGEAGEVVDCIKKIRFSTFPEKVEKARGNLTKEIGDLLYYVNILCHVHNVSLEQIMQENVDKLNERYGKNGN